MRIMRVIFLWLFCLVAHAETFVAGKDYVLLTQAPSVVQEKVTVDEYFNYGCPACFNLQSKLEKWVSAHQAAIVFKQIPVVFHQGWEVYAKAYYAMNALNLPSTASDTLFEAIHQQKRQLINPKDMAAFFVEKFQVDQRLAESIFLNSTQMDLEVKNGMLFASENGIQYIPAFVVKGRYRTDLQLAKTPDRLIDILNFLITQ